MIANTLAITVAQRMRELATLRTLGASRRQVLGSVVLESVVVGIIGSIVGLFLGLAIAIGLKQLLEATGFELPSGGIVFTTRTIVVGLAVGTLIALLASLRPAFRATRIEPIAAVREGAVMPTSRFARWTLRPRNRGRGAVALFSYGVFAHGLDTKVRLVALVAGVLLLFVAVAMVASRVVRPLAFLLGAPGARFGGGAGSLARQNAVRNPARTASTAAAVMIGLALITFVAMIGESFRSSFSSAVAELFIADYSVTAGNNPLTSKAAAAAARAPGVEVLSEIRVANAKLDGKSIGVNGVDANLTKVVDMKWSSGSSSVPAQLGRDGAFIKERYADDHSLAVGSPLIVQTPTKTLRLHVEGIFDEPKGGSPFRDVAISKTTFDNSFATHDNEFTLLNVERRADGREHRAPRAGAPPVPRRGGRDAGRVPGRPAEPAGQDPQHPLPAARPLGDREPVRRHQRARPLGLRADARDRDAAGRGHDPSPGPPDDPPREHRHRADRRGAGIAVGIFLAGLTTIALSDYGVVFAIPYRSLAAFVVVAILAGMLAAILPARRASRLNVLEALQYEVIPRRGGGWASAASLPTRPREDR